MNKNNLQNYIEEEIEKFEKEFQEKYMLNGHTPSPIGTQRVWSSAYPLREGIKQFLSQSLHRIAKITAEEIVPDKKEAGLYTTGKNGGDCINYNREDDDIKREEYNQAISDLQTKIKEFGI